MKQQLERSPMSKYILASAVLLIGITAGCNSGSDKTATPATDSPVVNTTPVMSTDTNNMNSMNTVPMDTSKAKPNLAKKGGKGKVSVTQQKTSANNSMSMDNAGVYNNAEIMPTYPGGYTPMADFFSNNVEYPQDATDNGIEGTVEVNFAVDEMGKLSSAKVVSPRLGYGLEEEALRIVNKMPTWTPGRIKGKNVKTYYTLPVRFELN